MPPLRLYPLLIAGAACLTLAACGSDDDPPSQASAPPQTESAAPAQTAPAETPTPTAPDADTPGADQQSSAEPANGGDSRPKSESDAPAQPDADRSDADAKPESTDSAPAPDSAAQPQQAPASPLDHYAKDGVPATKAEAAAVRASLIGFQEAIGRQDRVAVCRLTIGLPEKSGPKTPMSCTSLTQAGAATPPTDENRKAIAAAKIVVGQSRATAELAPGFKMPLRKTDGLWRIDYGAINNPAASSR